MDDIDRQVCDRLEQIIKKAIEENDTFDIHEIIEGDPGSDIVVETQGFTGKVYATINISYWKKR